jgi:hypothetical protein
MHIRHRLPMIATVLLSLPAAGVLAQPAVDPSGHWEGAIHTPNKEVKIGVDLARSGNGELIGTFGNPEEHIAGYPLSEVAVENRTVRFVLKAGSGGGPFEGLVSDDGKSISGKFTASTAQGNFDVPFTLTRTGDARVEPTPKSAPISKELEGTWNAALEVEGKQMTVVLKLANNADGTSSGTTAIAEQRGAEIPITKITQNGSSVALDVKIVGGGFTGTLSPDRSQIVGTWTQGSFVGPLTFKRAGGMHP